MSMRSSNSLQVALVVGLALGAAASTPMACVPAYIYDGGAGGATSSGATIGSTSTMGSTSTGGGTSASTGTTSTGATSTGGSTAATTTTSTGGSCTSMDCSNPACTSYSCVPAVPTAPTGWTGYFEVYDGPTTGGPGCAGDYATQAFVGNSDLSALQATCSCSPCPATGQKCQITGTADMQNTSNIDPIIVVDAACNGTPNCGGALDEPPNWTGTPCDDHSYLMAGTTCGINAGQMCTAGSAPCNVAIQLTPTQVTGGTCTGTSTVTVTKPTPTWANLGLACGGPQPGTGCTGTDTCLPNPTPGFNSTVCVMKAGDNVCPAGQFTKPHVFYTGYTGDTRGCTNCACGTTVTGGDCSATVTVYSNTTCASPAIATLTATTAGGDCQPLTGNPVASSRKATFTTPTGGTCATTGGDANGNLPVADETTAVTFCCL